jgi:hypothetical protein
LTHNKAPLFAGLSYSRGWTRTSLQIGVFFASG